MGHPMTNAPSALDKEELWNTMALQFGKKSYRNTDYSNDASGVSSMVAVVSVATRGMSRGGGERRLSG